MNFRSRAAQTQPIHFQVTAIVDVMMVLLVFFILNWSQRALESELGVKVPTAKNAAKPSAPHAQVVLNIRASGETVVNGRVLKPDELQKMLTDLQALDPLQSVVLRADKSARYDDILHVLDQCKAANVQTIGFAAQVEKNP